MKLRQIIREYFSFSKGERIGIMILIVLMTAILIADRLIFYFERPAAADRKRFEELVAELERQQTSNQEASAYFFFDPNTIDSATLENLSLPFGVKQNMLKYRRHGGSFRNREDVRKIYGMNDSVYALIEPFITIKSNPAVSTDVASKSRMGYRDSAVAMSKTVTPAPGLEINRATAADLKKLYGIGPVLSERIIKYRDLLGGFYEPGQLKEVYGLTPETFSGIADQLIIDSTALRLININFADARELAKHPYLEWKDANRMIDYRDKTGFIEDKFLLLTDSVLSSEVFKKVNPYFQTKGN
ncbi:MAG: helix-hairpin-helix domain-containing protein [Mangrovibacterium sp.]